MAATLTADPALNQYSLGSGESAMIFQYVDITDSIEQAYDTFAGGGGTLTVTLHSEDGPVGTLIDPKPFFPFGDPVITTSDDGRTVTLSEEANVRPSTASAPNLILDRLSYTAPILAAGQSNQVTGSVNYQTTTITERGTPPNIPSTVSPLVLNAPDAITIHQAGATLPAPVHPPAPTPDPVVPAPQPVPTPAPVINFYVFNVTVNLFVTGNVTAYAGPVGGLQHQLLMLSADNLNITATAPNSFIHTGSGTDAIDVSAIGGNNVLDGGTGSNFLVGGKGLDTFFVDARGASSATWSTVSGFHSGDAATLWGITPKDFALSWVDGQGAVGSQGLTLHASAAGKPDASLTLAGFTTADLSNGKLATVFGNNGGGDYLYVHAA